MPYRKPSSWSAIKPGPGATLDRGDPINAGLAGYWLMNEGSGTIFDIARGNTGILTAGPTWKPGKFGKALNFVAASTQYVDLGTKPAHNIPGPVSISLWMKLAATGTGVKVMFGQADFGSGSVQYSFNVDRTAGKLEALANGSTIALTGTTALTAGVWYHCAMTRSGTTGAWTYNVYVNGRNDGSATTASNPTAQGPLSIARFGAYVTPFCFDGVLDNIRLYSRCITPNEVKRLANPNEAFAGIISPRRRIISGVAAAGGFFGRPYYDMIAGRAVSV